MHCHPDTITQRPAGTCLYFKPLQLALALDHLHNDALLEHVKGLAQRQRLGTLRLPQHMCSFLPHMLPHLEQLHSHTDARLAIILGGLARDYDIYLKVIP